MKVLLVNPPIPHKMRMLEFSDEAGRKAMSLRVMVGPPLALNELAGVIPDEEILILDQKTEQDQNMTALRIWKKRCGIFSRILSDLPVLLPSTTP